MGRQYICANGHLHTSSFNSPPFGYLPTNGVVDIKNCLKYLRGTQKRHVLNDISQCVLDSIVDIIGDRSGPGQVIV